MAKQTPKLPRATKLTDIDRAVYEIINRGGIDAVHAALYARSIPPLIRAGLIFKRPDGGYHTAQSSVPVPAAPRAPKKDPMRTLVVRIPVAWFEILDSIGVDRSTALREVLGPALMAARTRSKAG